MCGPLRPRGSVPAAAFDLRDNEVHGVPCVDIGGELHPVPFNKRHARWPSVAEQPSSRIRGDAHTVALVASKHLHDGARPDAGHEADVA